MLDVTSARFAFLDLETTGLSPWFGDRICEVGIVVTSGRRVEQSYQTLVNPERPVSPASARGHGLSDDDLARAPYFYMIGREILACLRGAAVVCHNAPFDLQFLDSEYRRMGREIEIPNLADSLTIAQELVSCPSYTLDALALRFGIETGPVHRALENAQSNRQVFFALLELAAGQGRSLEEFLGMYNSPAHPTESIQLPTELAEVLASGRRMHITYVDSDGRVTKRWITPTQVLGLSDYVYLRAYCHMRRAERSFRLDRILAIQTQ